MQPFYPFIHQPGRKKKVEIEPLPLYIELVPPPRKEMDEEKEEKRVEIIEIL